MRKTIFFLLGLMTVAISLSSCRDQDDVYKQYVKKGGYLYPQVATELTAQVGYKRAEVSWAAPKDPAIRTAKVFWENRTKSCDIDYSKMTGDKIVIPVGDLEERNYTFEVVNYDKDGNASMTKEITVSPYGENWLALHATRNIESMKQSGSKVTVTMSPSTNEMQETMVKYVNTAGDTVKVSLGNDEETLELENMKVGTRVCYQSSFMPLDGLDAVWSYVQKSPTPLEGVLDCTSWTAEVTDGQVWSDDYLVKNIFDGNISNKAGECWWSAQGTASKVFPKIIAIDTGKDSYKFNSLTIFQSPDGTSTRYANHMEVYFGDQPFDPNAGSDYAQTEAFKNCAYKVSVTMFTSTQAKELDLKSKDVNHRYIAVVWKDSRNKDGLNSLAELQLEGYDSTAP